MVRKSGVIRHWGLAGALLLAGAGCGEPEATTEGLTSSVEQYVENSSLNGVFFLKDDQTARELKLRFVEVHAQAPATVGENRYFVCADFEGEEGTPYDIDFILLVSEGEEEVEYEVTRVMVHKVNHIERYVWYEEDGVWKRKPLLDPGEPGKTPRPTPDATPDVPIGNVN